MNLDTVILKIGQAEIAVHKALLTAVSDYFRKAFDGSFREANERYITLEGDSERSLRMFIQWTYGQSLQFDTSSAALGFDALLPPDAAKGINGEDEPAANADNETERSPLFDEKRYHPVFTKRDLYRDKDEWTKNADEFYIGLTELYILADKYSVPQLRDDVVTAFVGQCWKWSWWPTEDDKALILLMATNLPASSKLRKFLACSIAWVGIPQLDSNPEHIMRSLRELDSDLAHEIGVTYAMKVHEADTKRTYQVSTDLDDHLLNACMFHDHAHLDSGQCRERIASRPHIFTAILDACAKAVWTKPAKED